MAKYKILQYRNECISCGACAAICPEFWVMDDDGSATLKEGVLVEDHYEREINSEDDKARNQEAADACPVQIIKVVANDVKKK